VYQAARGGRPWRAPFLKFWSFASGGISSGNSAQGCELLLSWIMHCVEALAYVEVYLQGESSDGHFCRKR
jgi:hypothetical protein